MNKANIQQAITSQIQFINGMVAEIPSTYSIDQFGTVFIKINAITSDGMATSINSKTIAILPAGIRPAEDVQISAIGSIANTQFIPVVMSFRKDGSITLHAASDSVRVAGSVTYMA